MVRIFLGRIFLFTIAGNTKRMFSTFTSSTVVTNNTFIVFFTIHLHAANISSETIIYRINLTYRREYKIIDLMNVSHDTFIIVQVNIGNCKWKNNRLVHTH